MQKCQAQPTLIRVAAAASASPASAFAGAAGGICSPYCRTIAAAGLSRIPTSPRSSTKAHSAAIRRTTSRRSLTENFPLALKNVPTSLPQQFLDEACPCGNARPLKVCCYSPLDGEIRPPFPSLRPAAPVTGLRASKMLHGLDEGLLYEDNRRTLYRIWRTSPQASERTPHQGGEEWLTLLLMVNLTTWMWIPALPCSGYYGSRSASPAPNKVAALRNAERVPCTSTVMLSAPAPFL